MKQTRGENTLTQIIKVFSIIDVFEAGVLELNCRVVAPQKLDSGSLLDRVFLFISDRVFLS